MTKDSNLSVVCRCILHCRTLEYYKPSRVANLCLWRVAPRCQQIFVTVRFYHHRAIRAPSSRFDIQKVLTSYFGPHIVLLSAPAIISPLSDMAVSASSLYFLVLASSSTPVTLLYHNIRVMNDGKACGVSLFDPCLAMWDD